MDNAKRYSYSGPDKTKKTGIGGRFSQGNSSFIESPEKLEVPLRQSDGINENKLSKVVEEVDESPLTADKFGKELSLQA